MVRFALKEKGKFGFICVSKTPLEFAESVQKTYWNWIGMQPYGSNNPIEEFLKEYDKVKIEVEEING